ncbi:MAG: peptide/nickel transport system permease protein [Chloroflexota bacterium]|nr:peptide/nickel transport system permease protein [Chloroflexota bacterium]
MVERGTAARVSMAVLIRLVLVILTFVLIIVLSQVALVSARTRLERSDLPTIAQQAWEGTQDYFTSLATGSLGEATSTSILGGQRRAMGQLLLDAYTKSMVLVLLAVGLAAFLGIAVGVLAAASRRARVRAVLLTITTLAVSLPSFLLAILLILGGAELNARYGIRLWPTFGFGLDDHLIVPVLVLAARPFAQIASFAYVATEDVLGLDYIRTARAKGLVESAILVRHALGNAAVPIIGAVATGLSIALSTLPVVEVFFTWPGLGFALLQAIRRFDAATTGTLLGSLAVTIAVVRFGLDALAGHFARRATGAAS